MKFLIVDDDPDVIAVISKLLTLKKHEVISADNALAAIDQITANEIDIVITDATMPEYSGFDLIRSIKNNEKYSSMTLAMLTGRREKEDIQHAVELGVQDYIVKPIEPEVLLGKIDSLVEKHEKRKAAHQAVARQKALLHLEVDLHRITDVGVTLNTPFALSEGTIFNADIEELTKHMIFKNRFRVIFSKETEKGMFSTELLLLDLAFSEKEILETLSDKWNKKSLAA